MVILLLHASCEKVFSPGIIDNREREGTGNGSKILVNASPVPRPHPLLVTFKGFLGFQNGGVEECERANQIAGLL